MLDREGASFIEKKDAEGTNRRHEEKEEKKKTSRSIPEAMEEKANALTQPPVSLLLSCVAYIHYTRE